MFPLGKRGEDMGNDPYGILLERQEWNLVKERVLLRDKRTCVQCGGRGDVHVHHSHYRADRMPWEYRESDLFTLCNACHKKVHGIVVVPKDAPKPIRKVKFDQ